MLYSPSGSSFWDRYPLGPPRRRQTSSQREIWTPTSAGPIDGRNAAASERTTMESSRDVVEADSDMQLTPMQKLIRAALQDDRQKLNFVHLSEQEAQLILDEMWTLLDQPLIPHITAGVQSYITRNKLRRFSLKVSLAYDKLPTALFLKGVVCVETESRGIGGFADVYCGRWGEIVVAIKRLRVYLAAPETQKIKLKQAFCRESMLWKNLSHRHILPFLGVSEDVFKHRTLSMILPWISKGSIRHYVDSLQRRGELQGEQFTDSVQEWLYQIALGLTYLHEEGIVHGDLHGGNILIDEDDTVRLTDFGMALIAEATSYQYASVHGGGATRWQAPELIDPEEFGLTSSRPTFSSDVYSFSCICIELYTGARPFSDLADRQLMRRVVKGTRPPRPESMSDAVWYLINLCWDSDRDKRPSADDVARTFGRISLLPSTPAYGRCRPSTTTIIQSLHDAVVGHPECVKRDDDEPILPAPAAFDIVASFGSALDLELFANKEVHLWFSLFLDTPSEEYVTIPSLLELITTIPIASRGWHKWEPVWSKSGQVSQWSAPESWTAADDGWADSESPGDWDTLQSDTVWGTGGHAPGLDNAGWNNTQGQFPRDDAWRDSAGIAPSLPPEPAPTDAAPSRLGWRNGNRRSRRVRNRATPVPAPPPPSDIHSSRTSWAAWQPDPNDLPSPHYGESSPGLFGPRSPRDSPPPESHRDQPRSLGTVPPSPWSSSPEEIGGISPHVTRRPRSRYMGGGALEDTHKKDAEEAR